MRNGILAHRAARWLPALLALGVGLTVALWGLGAMLLGLPVYRALRRARA